MELILYQGSEDINYLAQMAKLGDFDPQRYPYPEKKSVKAFQELQ